MTIFHTIAYPLSDPPTIAEIEAFPKAMYRKVFYDISQYYFDECLDPSRIEELLRNMKRNLQPSYNEYMSEIRQYIYKYDEPSE